MKAILAAKTLSKSDDVTSSLDLQLERNSAVHPTSANNKQASAALNDDLKKAMKELLSKEEY